MNVPLLTSLTDDELNEVIERVFGADPVTLTSAQLAEAVAASNELNRRIIARRRL